MKGITMKIVRHCLATIFAILLLCGIGQIILETPEFYFLTLAVLLVVPMLIGYIFLGIGLIRLKKWAWELLIINSIFAGALNIVFILLLNVNDGVAKGFLYWFFGLSLIIFPVFGISALIRRILKRKQN